MKQGYPCFKGWTFIKRNILSYEIWEGFLNYLHLFTYKVKPEILLVMGGDSIGSCLSYPYAFLLFRDLFISRGFSIFHEAYLLHAMLVRVEDGVLIVLCKLSPYSYTVSIFIYSVSLYTLPISGPRFQG